MEWHLVFIELALIDELPEDRRGGARHYLPLDRELNLMVFSALIVYLGVLY